MPVEVREIVIRGTITDGSGSGANSTSGSNNAQVEEDIIKACVEKVIEILKEKSER